ncbi:hypothetical protein FEM54_33645, partial [Pseudomonas edaphica]
MNLFNVQQARRRIFNAIDTVQRLDQARATPQFNESSMGRRIAERQKEQREQVRHTLDVLVAAHHERDALLKELQETKAALEVLIAAAPSKVLANAVAPQECRSSYCECERGKCSAGRIDKRDDVQYTGHGAKTGGLQQHSIGPEYPYITYKRGDYWRILDSRTGNTHYREFAQSET